MKMKRYMSSTSEMEQTMEMITTAFQNVSPEIIAQLNGRGYALIDNFLDPNLCLDMRNEAITLYNHDKFKTSQSTKWDPVTSSNLSYDKHNVFNMQLDGGDD